MLSSSLLVPSVAGDPNPVALLVWLAIGVGAVLIAGIALSITRRRTSAGATKSRSRETVETGSIARVA